MSPIPEFAHDISIDIGLLQGYILEFDVENFLRKKKNTTINKMTQETIIIVFFVTFCIIFARRFDYFPHLICWITLLIWHGSFIIIFRFHLKSQKAIGYLIIYSLPVSFDSFPKSSYYKWTFGPPPLDQNMKKVHPECTGKVPHRHRPPIWMEAKETSKYSNNSLVLVGWSKWHLIGWVTWIAIWARTSKPSQIVDQHGMEYNNNAFL